MADAELNGGGREASSAHHGQQETDRPANQHGGYCGSLASGPGPTNGFWRDADWLLCRDGKWRPVEPGTSPLAHGVPGRVGQLRAYGNAIVPQVAAEVIGAFMECRP
jgi:DNA (cytosine-5)-methyltransferase 1